MSLRTRSTEIEMNIKRNRDGNYLSGKKSTSCADHERRKRGVIREGIFKERLEFFHWGLCWSWHDWGRFEDLKI
jgi:hypothetical protein